MIPPDHDAAGNIVYDGTYIYQYDAWSRLVQVNLAAQPPPGGGPAIGDAVPGTQQLAGPLVKHFTYDGLGRLVRVLSPYPEPGATPPVGWTTAPVRSERLYYDGVRRIQEVYTDPLLALGESAAQGSGSAQSAINEGGEEEGQTLEGEEGQIESGSGEPGGEDPPGGSPNTFITYLEREYLWGPGDGITGGAGAGLDELIAIFDVDRRAWWTLLDASGDVVAIVDDGATTVHGYGTGATTSPARLCAQFAYDPYGVLLAVQELHTFPDPRTGHKGLHVDRLDSGVADPVSGAPIARHEVGAMHAYFVRNRHYAPALGRFMQRDPNATGLLALGARAEARGRLLGMVDVPVLATHLRDGVGVQEALRSRPLAGNDPFGLWEGSLVQMQSTATTSAYVTTSNAAQVAHWAALGSMSVSGGSLGATLGFGVATTTVSGVKAAVVWLMAGAVFVGSSGALVYMTHQWGQDDDLIAQRASIPAEAKAVLRHVRNNQGSAPPNHVGGRKFGNREGRLPPGGEYYEYDVYPHVKGVNRGTHRVVWDKQSGRGYYTSDHYVTFIQM